MIIPDSNVLMLIALHGLEHSATIVSNDRDFDRFAGVRRINPFG